jgi:hypothetical protein
MRMKSIVSSIAVILAACVLSSCNLTQVRRDLHNISGIINTGSDIVNSGNELTNELYNFRVLSENREEKPLTTASKVSEPKVQVITQFVAPKSVRPGDTMRIYTQYDLKLPNHMYNAEVTERLVLFHNGARVSDLMPPNRVRHKAAKIDMFVEIEIPSDADRGQYIIEHRIQSGRSESVKKSKFYIGI